MADLSVLHRRRPDIQQVCSPTSGASENSFSEDEGRKAEAEAEEVSLLPETGPFLGHVVSEEGVSTDPEKIQRIEDCPAPEDLHQVRSILGCLAITGDLFLTLVI